MLAAWLTTAPLPVTVWWRAGLGKGLLRWSCNPTWVFFAQEGTKWCDAFVPKQEYSYGALSSPLPAYQFVCWHSICTLKCWNVCVCVCVRMYVCCRLQVWCPVWHFSVVFFPWARNFTHIVPVYPAAKWAPGGLGANWVISPHKWIPGKN